MTEKSWGALPVADIVPCHVQFGGHHRLEDYARRGQEPKDEVSSHSMQSARVMCAAAPYAVCLISIAVTIVAAQGLPSRDILCRRIGRQWSYSEDL